MTRCSAYGDKPEVLEHIYDDNIDYTIAHFSIALEDYLKLKEKREEYKQCEICKIKVENKEDLYITADKHVKCIKCTNPSYANLFEKDSKNHNKNDPSVDKIYFLLKAKQKQCETCNITVENENELKIHRKSVHGPIPDGGRSPGKNETFHRQSVLELSKNKEIKENRNEKFSAPQNVEINEKVSTKSALEEHIDTVSKQNNVHLEMHEITPAVGNCWYEACASLMKYNKMRDISPKQLRKEVVDNIENCENFSNVFEMVFESDYDKFAKFKAKHYQEGEFTDEDGV